MPTSGKQWRKAREEGVEIRLPSGMTVALRPIEVDLFMRVGHIPDALAPTVNRLINGERLAFEVPALESLEQSKDWLLFLEELVTFAFVTPKVVNAPQGDDEISVEDVTYSDKLFVYRFFSYPAQVLEKFREEQSRHVAPLQFAADHGTAPIKGAGDKPVGRKTHRNAGRVDGLAVR